MKFEVNQMPSWIRFQIIWLEFNLFKSRFVQKVWTFLIKELVYKPSFFIGNECNDFLIPTMYKTYLRIGMIW